MSAPMPPPNRVRPAPAREQGPDVLGSNGSGRLAPRKHRRARNRCTGDHDTSQQLAGVLSRRTRGLAQVVPVGSRHDRVLRTAIGQTTVGGALGAGLEQGHPLAEALSTCPRQPRRATTCPRQTSAAAPSGRAGAASAASSSPDDSCTDPSAASPRPSASWSLPSASWFTPSASGPVWAFNSPRPADSWFAPSASWLTPAPSGPTSEHSAQPVPSARSADPCTSAATRTESSAQGRSRSGSAQACLECVASIEARTDNEASAGTPVAGQQTRPS